MCVLDGSSTLQDWLVWDKHPIRKQYDVVMDLGELRAVADQLCCVSTRMKSHPPGRRCPSYLL